VTEPLRDLLQGPAAEPRQRRLWPWGVGGAGLVAVGAVVVMWMGRSDGSDTGAGSVVVTSSMTTSATTVVELEGVSFDPDYLFYPTMLPAGMELCGPASGQSARFCLSGEVARLTVQVQEISATRMDSGAAVQGWPTAKWFELGETTTLGVHIEGVIGLTITAGGVPEEQLVAIARSIPLVGQTDLFELDMTDPLDPWVSIPDEAVAAILGIDVSEVYRGDSGWVPRTNTANLRLLMDSSPSLLSYAATLRYPQVIEGVGVPAVGGMGTGSQEQVSRISWSQRGLVWTIQSNQSLESLTEMVRSAVEVISTI